MQGTYSNLGIKLVPLETKYTCSFTLPRRPIPVDQCSSMKFYSSCFTLSQSVRSTISSKVVNYNDTNVFTNVSQSEQQTAILLYWSSSRNDEVSTCIMWCFEYLEFQFNKLSNLNESHSHSRLKQVDFVVMFKLTTHDSMAYLPISQHMPFTRKSDLL